MKGNTKSQPGDETVLIPLAGAMAVIFVPFAEINPLEWFSGWLLRDYLNLAVAMGTTFAAAAAFWGVRAAEKTQRREWRRQEELAAAERERRHTALVENLHDHMMRTAKSAWATLQETSILIRQGKAAILGRVGLDQRRIGATCTALGSSRHFSRQLEAFLPSAREQIDLSDLQCPEIKNAGRRFGPVFDSILHAIAGLEIKAELNGTFSESDIGRLGHVTLIVALHAEVVRMKGCIGAPQWELLPDVVHFVFPDFSIPNGVLSEPIVFDLLHELADKEKRELEDVTDKMKRLAEDVGA